MLLHCVADGPAATSSTPMSKTGSGVPAETRRAAAAIRSAFFALILAAIPRAPALAACVAVCSSILAVALSISIVAVAWVDAAAARFVGTFWLDAAPIDFSTDAGPWENARRANALLQRLAGAADAEGREATSVVAVCSDVELLESALDFRLLPRGRPTRPRPRPRGRPRARPRAGAPLDTLGAPFT